ncbi:MAG: hypothetical protein J5I99_03320 [Verrucomicrobia bacterium]|nr:hypothetical protein [Kiritimatiellia bacterium]MCO6400243.1 hypothetical protein [Verrucomicrobiota bacterium]
MKRSRSRPTPPIINFGKFRVDFPSRDRSLVENLKFAAFVALLLGVFLLLYQCQASWLTSRNARQTSIDIKSLPPSP